MNITILFPCNYFNKKQVEDDYKQEYEQAIKFNFNVILFDYDVFVLENKLNIFPNYLYKGTCIYRGWMLKTHQYEQLYKQLSVQGLLLINSPKEYENCHLFPNSYHILKNKTAQTLFFDNSEEIDWTFVKSKFDKFMIKDYVKSVKGHDFPRFFDSSYTDESLEQYAKELWYIRGNLFTDGIAVKQLLELSQIDNRTNEYRGFYLYGDLITLSKNSNQSETTDCVPEDFVLSIPKMQSNFYTIDFAQLSNGQWIVIETGDGQVSGLSPNQKAFEYYEQIFLHFNLKL